MVAQACAGSPGWRLELKRFHVEIAACGQERQKKRVKQEWAICAGTPSSINSHLRRRRCVLRVVVLIDQQEHSLMLARGSLATCYINVPMVDQNLSSSSNFLVWYVRATGKRLLCLGHWTALLVRNPAAYCLRISTRIYCVKAIRRSTVQRWLLCFSLYF